MKDRVEKLAMFHGPTTIDALARVYATAYATETETGKFTLETTRRRSAEDAVVHFINLIDGEAE